VRCCKFNINFILLISAFVGLLINIVLSIVHLYRAVTMVHDTVRKVFFLNFVCHLGLSPVSLFGIRVSFSPQVKWEESSNLVDPF
jgi:hypothetical protein